MSRRGVGRAVLRRLPLIGTIFGLGLGAWLVATNDLAAIGAAFGRVGWLGLVCVVCVRVTIVVLCGLAWERVLCPIALVERSVFVILRFVREGINTLLPVASVGGDVVGGRLLTFWGVTGALAAASILIDMLIQVGTQFLFALAGLGLLLQVEGEAAEALAGWMGRILAAAAMLLAAFFAVQRFGAAGFLERHLADMSRRFVREAEPDRRAQEPAGRVQVALDAVWAGSRAGRILQSGLLHLAGWGLGAFEIWIALACIGLDVSFREAVVVESLTQAMKAAAFPVPSGLGVQEGGYVLVGALFGIDTGTAIALSLVKRVPDVVLGLPSLVLWQTLEARRATILPSLPR